MKRLLLTVGAGALLLIGVVVLVVMLSIRGVTDAVEGETPGPWYPLVSEDGDPAVADFENHVPCALDPAPHAECERIKLGIVLYREAVTGEPTTYLISIIRVGVSDARETHEGSWIEGQGTRLDPEATTYLLDAGAPRHLRAYWAVGDDILFLLDDGMPRVGDAAYGYALNSIPIGRSSPASLRAAGPASRSSTPRESLSQLDVVLDAVRGSGDG